MLELTALVEFWQFLSCSTEMEHVTDSVHTAFMTLFGKKATDRGGRTEQQK